MTLYRRKIMHDLLADMNNNIKAATITTQTAHRELASINWEKFDELVRLENPYEVKHMHMFEAAGPRTLRKRSLDAGITVSRSSSSLRTKAKSDSNDGLQGTSSTDRINEVEDSELYEDVKHRIQNVFTGQLHQLHSTGTLSYRAYQDLVGALRKIDNDIELFDIKDFIYSKEPSLSYHVKSYYAQRLIAVIGLKLASLQTHRRVYANPFLLQPPHIVDDIIAKYDKVATEVEFMGAQLQVEHPRIAVAVKTQITAMRFLCDQKRNIDEKQKDGIIEESEADLLKVQIDRKLTAIRSHTQDIDPLPFKRAVSFHPTFGVCATDLLLFVKPKYKKYKPGDHILVQGQPSNGMYYIHSGICKFSRNNVPPGAGKYLYAGDVIGEVSVIFDEDCAGNVKAETAVETYCFVKKDILMFLQRHKELQDQLIKNYCVQRAAEYLRTTPRYRTWTELELMTLLMKGTSIDLYQTITWHYMDMDQHGIERILLLRGVVVTFEGGSFKLEETAAHAIEVSDRNVRNDTMQRHCLLFLVPVLGRVAAIKPGDEAPGAIDRFELEVSELKKPKQPKKPKPQSYVWFTKNSIQPDWSLGASCENGNVAQPASP